MPSIRFMHRHDLTIFLSLYKNKLSTSDGYFCCSKKKKEKKSISQTTTKTMMMMMMISLFIVVVVVVVYLIFIMAKMVEKFRKISFFNLHNTLVIIINHDHRLPNEMKLKIWIFKQESKWYVMSNDNDDDDWGFITVCVCKFDKHQQPFCGKLKEFSSLKIITPHIYLIFPSFIASRRTQKHLQCFRVCVFLVI